MPRSHERRKEFVGLVALFAVFLVCVVFLERRGQELTSPREPTSFNTANPGVKALFLLFQQQGFAVTRLEAPLQSLDGRFGMVFVIEPLDRPIDPRELAPLRRWIENGGTLVYSLTSPARPVDPRDPILGDIAVVPARDGLVSVSPTSAQSPYSRDINAISARSDVRIAVRGSNPYQTIFADAQGALVIHKKLGQGDVFAVTGVSARNGEILSADNAILFVNIAESVGKRKLIAFDEYHHGVGFEAAARSGSGGVFANLPVPLQRVLLHLSGVLAILVWNRNRRFGRPRIIHDRPATEVRHFVPALAQMWRRAHAPEVALATLYRKFVRELRAPGEVHFPAEQSNIVRYAEQKYQFEPEGFGNLIAQCEAIVAGQRATDQEAMQLADQIEQYRRRCHFDRLR